MANTIMEKEIVEPIGMLWVNAIRMTVIPLLITAVASGDPHPAPGEGRRFESGSRNEHADHAVLP
jgi:hypothetical protein